MKNKLNVNIPFQIRGGNFLDSSTPSRRRICVLHPLKLISFDVVDLGLYAAAIRKRYSHSYGQTSLGEEVGLHFLNYVTYVCTRGGSRRERFDITNLNILIMVFIKPTGITINHCSTV